MWLTLHFSLRSTTRLRQVNIISLEAMSPSSTSFAETVATLRYATRARCIVNMPVVNLDSGTATIRSLKKEVAALRRLLCDANVSGMNVFSFFFIVIIHFMRIFKFGTFKKIQSLHSSWYYFDLF